jgi:hypothetical protein
MNSNVNVNEMRRLSRTSVRQPEARDQRPTPTKIENEWRNEQFCVVFHYKSDRLLFFATYRTLAPVTTWRL